MVWRPDLESSRNSLGREGGRALQAEEQHMQRQRGVEASGVPESVGIRVYVWVYGVQDKVGA